MSCLPGVHSGVCSSLFLENRAIFSHEILYRCLWHYSDGQVTKIFYSYHLRLCLGPFFGIFKPIVLVNVPLFLITVQYFLMKFCTDIFSITRTVPKLKKFFTLFLSLLGAILRYFWGHFKNSYEILYRCSWVIPHQMVQNV